MNCFMLQAHIGGLKQYFLTLFDELLSSDEANQYVFFYFPHNEKELRLLRNGGWRRNAIQVQDQNEILNHLGAIDLFFCPFGALWPRPVPLPTVATLVDIQEVFYPQFFTPWDLYNRDYHFRGSARMVDRLVTISEYSKSTIVQHYGIPASRIVVSHLCADERYYQAFEQTGAAAPALPVGGYAFYPANRWLHKNHDLLLSAMRMLRDRGLVIPGVFTGYDVPGGYPLLEKAREYGIADQVHSLQYVSIEQMAALYKRATMLVFPSLFEGFGIPLVEAMAAGCPVVASRATSLPEIGLNAAEYFDPASPAELAAAIERVWTDGARREKFIEAGRRRALDFLPCKMAAVHLTAFEEARRSFSNLRYLWQRSCVQHVHRGIIFLKHRRVLRAHAHGQIHDGMSVTFGKGWHGREVNATEWRRWAEGRGEIIITTPHDGTLEISGQIASIQLPNTITVRLDGKAVAECILACDEFRFCPLTPIAVPVGPGRHVIEIVSTKPAIVPEGDGRKLAVAVKNLEITVKEPRPREAQNAS